MYDIASNHKERGMKGKTMKEKKTKIIIGGVLIVIIVGCGSFFLGKKAEQQKNLNMISGVSQKNEEQMIAVVNLDEGTGAEKEKMYYGEKVIEFPSESFVYTSLEDARGGIENGTYGAYIIIPATFSENVGSLNGTPNPAQLQYALNTDLDGEEQKNILYQVLTFGETLNKDLTYMYIANILEEFHEAQNEAGNVMANDLKDKAAIEAIQASDLVQMVMVPDLVKEENTTQEIDIMPYMEKNNSLVNDVDGYYKENITDSKNQLEEIKQGGNVLEEALDELSAEIGEINLTTDEAGNNLYQEGLLSMERTLSDYNNSILDIKVTSLTDIETLKSQKNKIGEFLEKSIEVYNDQLDSDISNKFSEYKDGVKNIIPELTCETVEGSDDTQYQISCNRVQGMQEAPIVTVEIVSEDSEEALKRIECLNEILCDITDGANQDKTVMEILNICDSNDELTEKIQECGYSNSLELLTETAAGNVEMNSQIPHIEITGNFSELESYIKEAIDTIPMETYQAAPYAGYAIKQNGDMLLDENGQPVTVEGLLNNYDQYIGGVENKVRSIEGLGTQGVTDIINNQCILPLVNRTEDVKGSFQQRYLSETEQIENYSRIIDSYHPVMDTSKINQNISEMRANGSKMQMDIIENKNDYVAYADKVYTATQENTTTLLQHITEAKEVSDMAVMNGLADAKEIKAETSGENQQAMGAFSQKLPYTRLGTMEFTQAYEFISNPILVTEVSEYTRLRDEVSIQVDKNKETNEAKSNKSVQLQKSLYMILFVVIIGIAIGYGIHRQSKKKELDYIGS